MIMHIDANSFYAACECIFRPDLDGKPIAVLSNNDGVTIALNKECKMLGFRRGDTYFKMKDEYKKKNVNVFSSNYTLYADISMRLNTIYSDFCPEVELYSIDESFLFFPNWTNVDFVELGQEIKRTVFQNVHMPVSVGIAPSKTLAKICNKLAKTRNGVCYWNNLDKDEELKNYPVQDVWGIGYSKSRFLYRYGIRTSLDLKNYPLDKAKKNLTITGMKTVQELNEIQSIDTIESDTRKNITSSRSFATGVTELPELETALAEYCQLAVSRMRQEGSACSVISIYLMTARSFCPETKCNEYFNGASAKLPQSTSFLPDILGTAIMLLKRVYVRGYKYRKIMVNLLGLEKDIESQLNLFETDLNYQREKKKSIMRAFDDINDKYGRGMLHMGIRNQICDIKKTGENASWLTNREYLSPEYSTKLSDLPEVI